VNAAGACCFVAGCSAPATHAIVVCDGHHEALPHVRQVELAEAYNQCLVDRDDSEALAVFGSICQNVAVWLYLKDRRSHGLKL